MRGIIICDSYHVYLDDDDKLVGVSFISCSPPMFFVKKMINGSLEYIGMAKSPVAAMRMLRPQRTPTSISFHCGVQKLYKFANGYECSVACNAISEGHQRGLWELMVISPNRTSHKGIGWLTEAEVEKELDKIEAL